MPAVHAAVHKPAQPATGVMAVLHVGFVLTGMANTMLGPLLPLLAGRWALNDAQAGYLFVAQFGASIIGVTVSSVLVPRWGSRRTLILGMLTMGLGTGTLGLGSWTMGIVAASLIGAGFGVTIPTTNLLVSDLNPHKRSAALNLINFSWGVGAVSCPFIIAGLHRIERTDVFTYGMLTLLLMLTAAISVSHVDAGRKSVEKPALDPRAWRNRLVPVLAGIFFLYVGSEASVGGWIAAYAHRTVAASDATWILTPSFFWATLLAGRATAPAVLRHVPELLLARMGVLLAAAGIIGFLVAPNMWILGSSVALAGLGFSAVYPIAIAVLSQTFGAMAPRVGGLMFSLAGLGGTVMPWVVGYVSTRSHSLRIGLTVPLIGCATMFALYTVLAVWSKNPESMPAGYEC